MAPLWWSCQGSRLRNAPGVTEALITTNAALRRTGELDSVPAIAERLAAWAVRRRPGCSRSFDKVSWYYWLGGMMVDTRWQQLAGGLGGEEYAARFRALAENGVDLHGEASFVAARLDAGGRVLDAGCGTGRVAIRLAELGFDCVGVDVDESMLAVARREAPQLPWFSADLAAVTADHLGDDRDFDAVVLAGNVVPLLAEGTLSTALHHLADLVRPGGELVAGFGLDAAHLPRGCPVTALADYDHACARAGLVPESRFATWDAAPFRDGSGYVVTVHRRPA